MTIRAAVLTTAITAVVALAACHSGGEGGLVEQGVPPTPREVADTLVEGLEPGLGAVVLDRARAVPSPTLSDALDSEPAAPSSQTDLAASRTPEAIDIDGIVRELYAARGAEPVFVVDGLITPNGQAVLDALDDSWAHGLWPTDYGVESVVADLATMDEARHALATATAPVLTDAEREGLAEAIARRPDLLERDVSELEAPVLDLILNPADGAPSAAPSLASAYNQRVEATLEGGEAAVRAELALATGLLRYAWDVRFSNPHWFEDEEGEVPPDEALAELRRQALRSTFEAGLQTDFATVAAALPPDHDQYVRLVAEHRRYREIVENGGWRTDLEPVEDLRAGDSDEMVVRLRERLAAEGYYTGDDLTSEDYDREIRHAFELYQRTHQFRDDGRLHDGEINSLNTPALERAQHIAVTLERWRESWIANDETYIFVNVPDYHAEVWREGNRDMRFRIIVGSTMRFRSEETGEWVYPRATPNVHEDLRFIVFNPYWNVPQGIMYEEYDPNLEENPYWYQDNGYEVMINDRGVRWVRQMPGQANALGRVKFLFPNEHDVYLHDTPTRRLFARDQRTFSHGCMRVQDPMELAYYLLEHDRAWDRERVDEERGATVFRGWRPSTSIPVAPPTPAPAPSPAGLTGSPTGLLAMPGVDGTTTPGATPGAPTAATPPATPPGMRPWPDEVPPVGRPHLPATDAEYIDRWISLRTAIPVHVEYYVVRVDDEGWANFLGDIYRRDQPLLAARAERELEEAARVAAGEVSDGLGVAERSADHVAAEVVQPDVPDQPALDESGAVEVDDDRVASE